MAGLVGRESEVARLRDLLQGARTGRGSALVVAGEPGIGKSTLLRAAEEEARASFLVLRTAGRECERGLPFAALASLVGPLVGRVEDLPGPQARALRGALALEDVPGTDPFGVAAATASVLALAAEEEPLLCVVDDAHWLDAASAAAVLFAAARLEDVSALAIFAARLGEPWPRGLDAFPALELAGLSPSAGVELLARDGRRSIPAAVARRLVERTGGNPLALLELGSLLDDDARAARAVLDDPLPVTETVTAAFSRQVAGMPEETRSALLHAAAHPEVLPEDVAALEPAERAGLVTLRGGTVEFSHPLVRSAVYYGAAEPDRRRAHARIAEALPGGSHSPRRALHRARAAAGPDEDIAAELEASAGATLRRGGVAETGMLLELAATLSPESDDRVRRLAEAANAFLAGADAARAVALVERAAAEAASERAEVAVERARGLMQLWQSGALPAHRRLAAAGEQAARFDRALAASIFAEAIWPAFTAAAIRPAIETGKRARELAEGTGSLAEQQAGALLGAALVLAGEAGRRDEAVVRVGRLLARDAFLGGMAPTYALTMLWLEDFAEAEEALRDALSAARLAGALTSLPTLLGVESELAWWRGDLRGALAGAQEGEKLCAQLGTHIAHPYVLSALARVEATSGAFDAAREHAERALQMARGTGQESIEIYAACALGLAHLGEGRHADAVAALERLRALYAERGIFEPNAVPWLGDLAEAATLAGDEERADGALADLDAMAERTGSRWAAGVAARARVLRAPLDAAEEEARRALDLLRETPFEQARVHLVLGERRRRARRRADARPPLRAALAELERIGARPWAERARRELAAAGEVVAAAPELLAELLSPQELQIALLVAEGLTNREVAARLIVSPKTVEYHLGNAFRKIGARSRVELVRRLEAA